VNIDFSKDVVKNYKFYEEGTFLYCNDLVKDASPGPNVTDEDLESVIWKLSKVPSYK
jgi:hypothetical protein